MCLLRTLFVTLLVFVSSLQAQLVINEVDADQAGSDTAEFIELYDGGSGNTSLDGFVIVLYNGSDDASYRVIDLSGQTTNAGGFFVVGNPGVPNVSIEIEPGGSGVFQNGPDAVALFQSSPDDFPNDTPITTEGLIDAVVYGSNDNDDFELLDGLTPGELQLDDTREESMSRIPDGGDAFASSTYALQAPTPGIANVITEALTLNLSAPSALESAGAEALEATVSRSGSTDAATVINLTLVDFTEARVPVEVTIPAGAESTTFFLAAVDDAWADGPQILTLSATSPGFIGTSVAIEIADDSSDPVGIIVNEFYPDDQDDANEDGEVARDGKDEFVEFVNVSKIAVDLSDHTLNDEVAIRHRFPEGTVIEPGCALVVFGGGDVIEGNNPLFGGATVQLANESNEFGLGFNNSGDFIRLLTPEGVEISGLRYDATNGDLGSRVREPDLTGDFVFHIDVVNSPALFIYTPGFTVQAEPFCALTLELGVSVEPNMIAEDAGEGASTLTLTRTGSTDDALTVNLANSDPSEISLPETVEIPAGAESITVSIGAVNDPAQDGDVVVTITASAADFLNGTTMIQVLDDGDAPAMIVINELDADQPTHPEGGERGEFVELYDGGVGNLQLDGFVLVLFNGANSESYAAYDLAGSSTNGEGFFVIGDAEVPNVSLAVNNFSLQNGPDAVALYRGFRSDFANGSFPTEDNLVDAVVYGTNDDDAVDLLETFTPDHAQINEGNSNNTDSIGREAEGGDPRDPSTYGTMVPSPGAANGSVQGASYATWAANFAELGEPEEDPDGDGFANALEYALNSNPLEASSEQQLTVDVVDGAVIVSIPLENEFPPGVAITYERSATLDGWETIDGLTGQLEDGFYQVRFIETLTEPRAAFIRIGAIVTP